MTRHFVVAAVANLDFKTSSIKKVFLLNKSQQRNSSAASGHCFLYFHPFISLPLNLNNADQVQSQRALEVDKGNS